MMMTMLGEAGLSVAACTDDGADRMMSTTELAIANFKSHPLPAWNLSQQIRTVKIEQIASGCIVESYDQTPFASRIDSNNARFA